MSSLHLRRSLLQKEPAALRCELDTFVGFKMEELKLREPALSNEPALTLQDIVFGLYQLDSMIRSTRRRSVADIQARFEWKGAAPKSCNLQGENEQGRH